MCMNLNDVVCVMNPEEKIRLQKYCGVDNIPLATPYDMQELRALGTSVPVIYENKIYSRHPYKNAYIELNDQSEDSIVLERINKIASIIALLGGKKMQVLSTSVQLNDQNRTIEGSLHGAITTENLVAKGGAETSYACHIVNSQDTNVSYEIEWTPGSYTEESYNEAVKLASEYKLDTDGTINTILDQRNPLHPNQMANIDYHVDVRTDLEQLKRIAVGIQGGLERYNVNVDLNFTHDRNQITRQHNTLDFRVEFGPLVLERKEESEEEKKKKMKKIKMAVTCVLSAIIIIGLIAVFLI